MMPQIVVFRVGQLNAVRVSMMANRIRTCTDDPFRRTVTRVTKSFSGVWHMMSL